MDKDYIPFERYEAICEKEGISKEDNQRILIRLLNDLDVVLNFHDDPRLEDTYVLNPEWVTNGVYKIINETTITKLCLSLKLNIERAKICQVKISSVGIAHTTVFVFKDKYSKRQNLPH